MDFIAFGLVSLTNQYMMAIAQTAPGASLQKAS